MLKTHGFQKFSLAKLNFGKSFGLAISAHYPQ